MPDEACEVTLIPKSTAANAAGLPLTGSALPSALRVPVVLAGRVVADAAGHVQPELADLRRAVLQCPVLPRRNRGGVLPQALPPLPRRRLQGGQLLVRVVLLEVPRPALREEPGIDVDISEVHDAERAAVLVRPSDANPDFLPLDPAGKSLACLRPVFLPFSGASIPSRRTEIVSVPFRTSIVSPSFTAMHFPEK